MKYQQYLKRDAVKNYFPLPNEIFCLGLCSGEIAVYAYLLYCEDRKTFQCYPSCCATCANWSGQTEYQFPGIVYYDSDGNKGTCNSTFLGAQTEAHQCCSNWEQRYRNH